MQYRYKSARRIIKKLYKFKRALKEIYEDEDYVITELRRRMIKTTPVEFNENCKGLLKHMYEVLNNPNRFK
jgi:hypothetical protein